MANTLLPRATLAALAALVALGTGCGSDAASQTSTPSAGASSASAGAAASAGGSASSAAGFSNAPGGGGAPSGGTQASGGNAGKSNSVQSGGAPPAVNGQSVYTLECHGDSKDCNLATVPCFGVGSQTPNVAAGWACANRCTSNADCSDAPSGAAAQASCVSFSSASHCVLVCKNENQTFACPTGMTCYVPAKSPIGYCLWQ
ncbi:MAG TPA: hypothetical protein VER96_22450 [Polyangiaceae bacterium]|nr:hypothetical protein [Polyangiaceae bacterium]